MSPEQMKKRVLDAIWLAIGNTPPSVELLELVEAYDIVKNHSFRPLLPAVTEHSIVTEIRDRSPVYTAHGGVRVVMTADERDELLGIYDRMRSALAPFNTDALQGASAEADLHYIRGALLWE